VRSFEPAAGVVIGPVETVGTVTAGGGGELETVLGGGVATGATVTGVFLTHPETSATENAHTQTTPRILWLSRISLPP
jgi:hypothetical protein